MICPCSHPGVLYHGQSGQHCQGHFDDDGVPEYQCGGWSTSWSSALGLDWYVCFVVADDHREMMCTRCCIGVYFHPPQNSFFWSNLFFFWMCSTPEYFFPDLNVSPYWPSKLSFFNVLFQVWNDFEPFLHFLSFSFLFLIFAFNFGWHSIIPPPLVSNRFVKICLESLQCKPLSFPASCL